MMDANERIGWMLEDARRDTRLARGRLREQAVSVADQMERLIRSLDAGSSFNSLGELQGRGVELDRLCGELHVREYELKRLERVVELAAGGAGSCYDPVVKYAAGKGVQTTPEAVASMEYTIRAVEEGAMGAEALENWRAEAVAVIRHGLEEMRRGQL